MNTLIIDNEIDHYRIFNRTKRTRVDRPMSMIEWEDFFLPFERLDKQLKKVNKMNKKMESK